MIFKCSSHESIVNTELIEEKLTGKWILLNTLAKTSS